MSTVIPKFALTPEWVAKKADQQEADLAERSKSKYEPGDVIESAVQRTVSAFPFRVGKTRTFVSFNSRVLEFGGFRMSVIEEAWIDNALIAKYNLLDTVLAPNMTIMTSGVIVKEGDTASKGVRPTYVDKQNGSVVKEYQIPRIKLAFVESSTVTEFVPPAVETV